MPDELTLCVAAMQLRISAPASLASALYRKYAAFIPHTGEKADLSLTATLSGTYPRDGRTDPPMEWNGTQMLFSAPGFNGLLNLDTALGSVTVSHANAVNDVDFFIRVAVGLLTHQRGGVLLHAAGVNRPAGAAVFVGHSGSGKTTVAGYANAREVLNDDLIVLLPQAGGWLAHATPFTNPTQTPPNPGVAPLRGIFNLVKDDHVQLSACPSGQAAAILLGCIPILAAAPGLASGAVERVAQILDIVPFRHLHFRKAPDFWPLVDACLAEAANDG